MDSVDVLDQNSHWVFSGAILSQNVLAFLNDFGGESVGDVVKGVDELSFQCAGWFRIESEGSVTDILEHVLGGGKGQDFLDPFGGLNILIGKTGVGLDNEEVEVLLVGGHAEINDEFLLSGSLGWVTVMGDIWVPQGLEVVLNSVQIVLEESW